jgi:hypothetical protein
MAAKDSSHFLPRENLSLFTLLTQLPTMSDVQLGKGNLMQRFVLVTAFCAVTVACAPTPESIAPAYVSEVPYRSWTCDQLGEENARLQQALATSSQQQSNARSNDTVGIILIGLPVGSMSGQSIAPQIALYKGQVEAVHRASIRNSCPEMTRVLPNTPPPGPAKEPGVQPSPPPPTATVTPAPSISEANPS